MEGGPGESKWRGPPPNQPLTHLDAPRERSQHLWKLSWWTSRSTRGSSACLPHYPHPFAAVPQHPGAAWAGLHMGECRFWPRRAPPAPFRSITPATGPHPPTPLLPPPPCSVRFSLLGEASQAAAWPATAGAFRPLASVQLRSRHWVIRDGRGEVDSEVRGEAVVGHYPLLIAGEWAGRGGACVPLLYRGPVDAVRC